MILKKEMRIICSGGGTGGHIFPAIAVAQELKKRNPDTQVLFVGAKGKMEMTKVPKAGFEIKGLWISGWQRSLTFKNALFPFKVGVSLLGAFKILLDFKPDAVAGFGGYASGAAVWVASKMGIPTLIMEQNSFPGMTNKMLNGKADTVCIAYEEAQKFFSKSKTVLTGNPIRKGLDRNMDRSNCLQGLGLDLNKQTILIIGGSLGAKSINEAISESYEDIALLSHVQIVWQCGKGYYDRFKSGKVALLEHVHILDFIDDMAMAYGAADIVISRAGALSIAELMYMAKPAILVPSPNVAEDHQTKNAQSISDKDAGILLPDSEVKDLMRLAIKLLNMTDRLKELSQNISTLSKTRAVEDIVDELEILIRK